MLCSVPNKMRLNLDIMYESNQVKTDIILCINSMKHKNICYS